MAWPVYTVVVIDLLSKKPKPEVSQHSGPGMTPWSAAVEAGLSERPMPDHSKIWPVGVYGFTANGSEVRQAIVVRTENS